MGYLTCDIVLAMTYINHLYNVLSETLNSAIAYYLAEIMPLVTVVLMSTKDNLVTWLVWRGGLVVGRRTCDLVVAGSRPGCDAAA